MEKYNLRDDYALQSARVMGVALDWEVLGLYHRYPKGYHFTKQSGQPDKRYSNYPEVLAYYEAELLYRKELIERATHDYSRTND